MQGRREKESGKNVLWLNAGDFYQGITIVITNPSKLNNYKSKIQNHRCYRNFLKSNWNHQRHSVVLALQVEGCHKVNSLF